MGEVDPLLALSVFSLIVVFAAFFMGAYMGWNYGYHEGVLAGRLEGDRDESDWGDYE
jgi:hypothetical protein